MKIHDKVYVFDWGQQYTSIYKFVNGTKQLVFDWKTEIPLFSDTQFHWKFIREPRLTQKGEPFKNGDTILVDKIPVFKDYEYRIIEKITHNDKVICLLKSKEGCWVQIGEKGLTTLSKEEFEELEKLHKSNHLKALAKQHLKRWTITDNVKDFPEELRKVYYDSNQNVLFGSSMTKGIVTYEYIRKEYTKDNRPILICTSVDYNGKGCDLSDKDVITFKEAEKLFNR